MKKITANQLRSFISREAKKCLNEANQGQLGGDPLEAYLNDVRYEWMNKYTFDELDERALSPDQYTDIVDENIEKLRSKILEVIIDFENYVNQL